MSNLEIDGYNNCNVYGNNYGKHDFEPMNKLHEALKNEELMLEVGRKATEEQKAMTQSTVEERFNELFGYASKQEILEWHLSELRLAEQMSLKFFTRLSEWDKENAIEKYNFFPILTNY